MVEPTPCRPQATHCARYTTFSDPHVRDLPILKIFLVITERKLLPETRKFLQQSQRLAEHL